MTTGQTVLITGANAGIGRAIAIDLARHGYTVIATARRPDTLDELRAACDQPNLLTVPLDVTDAASIQAAVTEVDRLTESRGIDVLINNAGFGQFGALLEVPDAALRRQFEVNVFGLMAVTRAFAEPMITRGSGRIINLSSVSGRYASPFTGAYNGSKFAVEAMSDVLRVELAPFGVRVVIIEPGFIKTGFREATQNPDHSPVAHSRYESAYAFYWEYLHRRGRRAPGPELIARVVRRAIEAPRPRARYMTPWLDRLQAVLLRTLPPAVTDRLLSRVLGLNRVARGTRQQASSDRVG